MNLFFEPDFSSNGHFLSQDESKHCIRVLRHQAGDVISVMDGKGCRYTAQITDANSKKCGLKIIDTITVEPRPFSIHMLVAPTKNIDRFEWFLEKATEIGIEEITPIICEHSERKIIKPERLEKVIVSAAKQSLKAYMPKLNPLNQVRRYIEEFKSKRMLYRSLRRSTQTIIKKGLYSACKCNNSNWSGRRFLKKGNSNGHRIKLHAN